MSKKFASLEIRDYRPISIMPVLSKAFEKIAAGKLSNFFGKKQYASSFSFSYRRGLRTCDALLTLSHILQVAFDRGMEGRLVQLNFSTTFDRVSHSGLLYKFRSIGVGGQFLSIVSKFLSDIRQRVRLDGKVSALVNVISGVTQGSVLGPLLCILYSSELFHIVRNHIVGYADDTTIDALIPRPLSRSQGMKSPNQDLAAINSWCLRWHMRLNSKKAISIHDG